MGARDDFLRKHNFAAERSYESLNEYEKRRNAGPYTGGICRFTQFVEIHWLISQQHREVNHVAKAVVKMAIHSLHCGDNDSLLRRRHIEIVPTNIFLHPAVDNASCHFLVFSGLSQELHMNFD